MSRIEEEKKKKTAANHWMYYLNVCVCVQETKKKKKKRKLYMMTCFTGSKYSDTEELRKKADAVFYYNALIFGDVF